MGLFSRTRKPKSVTVSTKPDEDGLQREFNFEVWPKDGKPRGRSQLKKIETRDAQDWLLRQSFERDGSSTYAYMDETQTIRLLGRAAVHEHLHILKDFDEENGRILRLGAFKDYLPDGPHDVFPDDGRRERTIFKKGEMSRVEVYDDEDRRREVTDYSYFLNLSYTTGYHENGDVIFRLVADLDAKLRDKWLYLPDGGFMHTCYDADGNPAKDYMYDENDVLVLDADYTGETIIVKVYRDGEVSFKSSYDKESRTPVGEEEHYQNGRLWFKVGVDENGLNGRCEEFDENGKMVAVGAYKDSEEIGIWEYPENYMRFVLHHEGRELAHGTDEDALAQAIEERMGSKDLDIEEHDILWEALLDLAARMMHKPQNDPDVSAPTPAP